MQISRKSTWVVLLSLLMLISPACNTSKSAKGAIIGGATGGVIGGLIGKKSGNTVAGILVGAAIGGAAGALIGKYMDKQAKKIEEEVKSAEVVRVEEGILVTFDSGILFGFDSYALSAKTKAELRTLANTLKEYEDTEITIEGHTDSKGTETYNYELSKKRANAVSSFLSAQGVAKVRLKSVGYGEQQPIDDNTEAAANRRVEIAIVANKDLKQAAKSGKLK